MFAILLNAVFALAAAIAIFRAGRRGIAEAFCLAMTLLVLLPTDIRISAGGSLPELTVHRIILIALFICWMKIPRTELAASAPGFMRLLILLLICRGLSMLFSITPLPSFKDLLGFAIEIVLFFKITSSLMAGEEIRIKATRAIVYGLFVVAVMAVVEKYRGISVPGALLPQFRYLGDGIQSSYPDQHLFGYAMAMGVPLAAAMLELATTRAQRRSLWIAMMLMVAGCYFSTSRGAWMGLAIGFGVYFILGSAAIRKRYMVILCLGLVASAIRPGVRSTIMDRWNSTFKQDDVENQSFSYRGKLWHIAWAEISKAPERLALGYGGMSTESMDLGHYFGPGEGGNTFILGYTSWDNQYACDLIEFGLADFTLEMLLFLAIIYHLFRNWQTASGDMKVLSGALMASAAVFLFAQTNLWIFSIQLKFLFWAVVAIGTAVPREVFVPASVNWAKIPDEPVISGTPSAV